MLEAKAELNNRIVDNIMLGADTVVFKYTIAKQEYDNDANFMVYRAAGIHFYFSEIQVWRVFFEIKPCMCCMLYIITIRKRTR